MELLSLDCPRCSAHLPPQDPTGRITCAYCGADFQATQAKAARNQAGQQLDPQQLAQMIARELAAARPSQAAPSQPHYGAAPGQYHSMAAAPRTTSSILWFIIAFSLLGTLIPVALVVYRNSGLAGLRGVVDGPKTTGGRMLYYPHNDPPARVEFRGRAAFIGPTHEVLPEDRLFIDAHDASSLDRLWRIGPVAVDGVGYPNVHFAAAGDTLLLSRPDAKLTVHDLATGEQRASHALTDKVDRLCSGRGGDAKKVYVRKADEKHLVFDAETGALRGAPDLPPWCSDTPEQGDLEPDHAPLELAPSLEGMRAWFVRSRGEIGVAGGYKHPGTAVPMLAGFDPRDGSVLWQAEAFAVQATSVREHSMEFGSLSGGRFFTAYASGIDAWHTTAFDAESGRRLWHVDLRPVSGADRLVGVFAADDYVIVARNRSAEVYDAETGALRGTIGEEDYE